MSTIGGCCLRARGRRAAAAGEVQRQGHAARGRAEAACTRQNQQSFQHNSPPPSACPPPRSPPCSLPPAQPPLRARHGERVQPGGQPGGLAGPKAPWHAGWLGAVRHGRQRCTCPSQTSRAGRRVQHSGVLPGLNKGGHHQPDPRAPRPHAAHLRPRPPPAPAPRAPAAAPPRSAGGPGACSSAGPGWPGTFRFGSWAEVRAESGRREGSGEGRRLFGEVRHGPGSGRAAAATHAAVLTRSLGCSRLHKKPCALARAHMSRSRSRLKSSSPAAGGTAPLPLAPAIAAPGRGLSSWSVTSSSREPPSFLQGGRGARGAGEGSCHERTAAERRGRGATGARRRRRRQSARFHGSANAPGHHTIARQSLQRRRLSARVSCSRLGACERAQGCPRDGLWRLKRCRAGALGHEEAATLQFQSLSRPARPSAFPA